MLRSSSTCGVRAHIHTRTHSTPQHTYRGLKLIWSTLSVYRRDYQQRQYRQPGTNPDDGIMRETVTREKITALQSWRLYQWQAGLKFSAPHDICTVWFSSCVESSAPCCQVSEQGTQAEIIFLQSAVKSQKVTLVWHKCHCCSDSKQNAGDFPQVRYKQGVFICAGKKNI